MFDPERCSHDHRVTHMLRADEHISKSGGRWRHSRGLNAAFRVKRWSHAAVNLAHIKAKLDFDKSRKSAQKTQEGVWNESLSAASHLTSGYSESFLLNRCERMTSDQCVAAKAAFSLQHGNVKASSCSGETANRNFNVNSDDVTQR